MRHRSLSLLAATALAVVASALTSAAPAHAWQCESSALRGTVLGQTLEPVTANRGAPDCRTTFNALTGPLANLPLPLDASSVAARTTLAGPAGQPAAQQAGAAGGIADLRVRTLPELPLRIPLPDLSGVPPVAIPALGISVDIRPALQALLPDGKLPNVDLVRVRALTATADAACVNGQPQLRGDSQVTGLTILGQDTPLNGVVNQVATLVDSGSIDPSKIDIAKVVLPAGVTLPLSVVQAALQPILDGLPDIAIPAAVAQIRVTPGDQLRDATSLTQRAVRIQVAVLNQPLADIVVGEATVRSTGGECTSVSAPSSGAAAAELALACTTRRLVLSDVVRAGDRVLLTGFADRRYIGQRVSLEFRGRRVATATVNDEGRFRALAPLPKRSIRGTNAARYRARIGNERSLRLKLARRMTVTGVAASRTRVVISGRVSRPLARPARSIEIRQRISCSRWRVVARVRPRSDGTFRVAVAGPPQAQAAVYRLATRVRKTSRNRRTYPTFTLPRYVDLG